MVLETNHSPKIYRSSEFEQLYTNLRQVENRIYTDDEVKGLPNIHRDHVYVKEWEIRKASCERLVRYLESKDKPLKILEIGCGNGWLSHRLSQIRSSYVVGLDVNLLELQQAERVFSAVNNLAFVFGDIESAFLDNQTFDVVIFAAAIQYFRSLPGILQKVAGRLNEGGEIHLLDSHFYEQDELTRAYQRSADYFQSKGFDRMCEFYFHRSLDELDGFKYTILYNPNTILNRVFGSNSPFYWICVK